MKLLSAPPALNALPAPTCSICNSPAYRYQYAEKPVCDNCNHQIDSYSLKVQTRAERLYNRAEKINAEASAGWERAHQMAQVIPMGQPILIGHHSEKADRAYRERIWNTQKRAYEKGEYAKELERRAQASEKNRAISSDDPAAILKLEAKLADLTTVQEHMKAVNKLIHKFIPRVERMNPTGHHGTVAEINARFKAERERVHGIQAEYIKFAPELAKQAGISESTAIRLLTPDMLSRIGYADYELKNNNAEIRRCKARIETLRNRKSTADDSPHITKQGDITIERNTNENRLRLKFPAKPAHEVISVLKSNGFHWSPSNMAWQRQLNQSAEFAAQRVLQYIQEKAS